jgi:hypothetical protein
MLIVIRSRFVFGIADPGHDARADNIVAGVDDAGIQTGESKKQPIDLMGTKLI